MTSVLRPADFIAEKRDGRAHEPSALEAFVRGWVDGSVMPEQAAAWSMAVFFRGLNDVELMTLTRAMRDSGTVSKPSSVSMPRIDKHSTGGVGDKVSLCLAPLVAACGVRVPMISGRGLGHTGGTLDKLSAIPGFTAQLDPDRFEAILDACGLCLAGASPTLAPADRLLYGIRDACGTVESIPLIIASILSKKLAAGLHGLVLDVKVGSGAFMSELEDARTLARGLVEVATRLGCPTRAVLTDMDAPLGRAVGNAAEFEEAVALLDGGGPSDLWEVTQALGVRMLELASIEEPHARLERARADGSGRERLERVVAAQGGEGLAALSRWRDGLRSVTLSSPRAGYVHRVDARAVGRAAMEAGAGRRIRTDPVDPAPSVLLGIQRGDRIEVGQPWVELWLRPGTDPAPAKAWLEAALTMGDEPPAETGRILEEVQP